MKTHFVALQPKSEDTISNNYHPTTPDWKMSFSHSPGAEDVSKYRLENNQLRLQIKQLNMDLQSEQGTAGVTPEF